MNCTIIQSILITIITIHSDNNDSNNIINIITITTTITIIIIIIIIITTSINTNDHLGIQLVQAELLQAALLLSRAVARNYII